MIGGFLHNLLNYYFNIKKKVVFWQLLNKLIIYG